MVADVVVEDVVVADVVVADVVVADVAVADVVVSDVAAGVDGAGVVRAAGPAVVVTPWIKLGSADEVVDSPKKEVSWVGQKFAIAVVSWLFGVSGSLAIKNSI